MPVSNVQWSKRGLAYHNIKPVYILNLVTGKPTATSRRTTLLSPALQQLVVTEAKPNLPVIIRSRT